MSNSFPASRLAARDDLFTSLGLLAAPILRAAADLGTDPSSIPFLRSQFRKDYNEFVKKVEAYGKVGATEFQDEWLRVRNVAWELHNMLTVLEQVPRRGDDLTRVENIIASIRSVIHSIPMQDPDMILPAASPFMTYLTLRAHCAGARNRVDLFDPYLNQTPFHRYLCVIDAAVPITLVTSDAVMVIGANNLPAGRRRDRILAVSELLAAERPTSYRFLVAAGIHDRHLRIDDQIFHLGGSVKDAGRSAAYTIAKLDNTTSNHAALDALISSAEEWFGRSVGLHRRS
jgi:hypothetical protein